MANEEKVPENERLMSSLLPVEVYDADTGREFRVVAIYMNEGVLNIDIETGVPK